MGASSDGYTVKSGMSGQAKELDAAGDDAGKIGQAIQPGMCYMDDALGGHDAAAAFNAYAAAWEAEAKALESALHELADKVRLSKGAYHGSDSLVDTSVRSVRVGDSSVSTMPAPVGDGYVSTMPAHGTRPSALADY
ncbi:hypothetical protein [Streptomyces monashensis]|uniref:ESX-1 secretion-associated protein n=1 Tax=Streptomyces monashensis TaxID=1678012 RepID=A0A1S2QP66_9ACTN|nr:hypothetical protein [Streptomyces monashensis]OIK07195.1 hypothetical protein BIV23_03650 [Streptomyces monashensis]